MKSSNYPILSPHPNPLPMGEGVNGTAVKANMNVSAAPVSMTQFVMQSRCILERGIKDLLNVRRSGVVFMDHASEGVEQVGLERMLTRCHVALWLRRQWIE
jgi:hypothetical protein